MDEQHVLSQVHTLFHGKVKYLHLGCPDNFHPKSKGFKERINQALSILGLYHEFSMVCAPKVQFTNIVVHQGTGNFVFEEENGLCRTIIPADGVIINYRAPIAIFNADCHVGILYHEKTGLFALIHLGLKCFYREDGSPNIIDQAIAALDAPVHELFFWYGAGIGPCCNGYDHSDPQNEELGKKLNQIFRYGEENGLHGFPVVGYHGQFSKTPEGKVLYGPRAGQISYNNGAMIFSSAMKRRDLETLFDCDCSCTSCQGREQHPELPKMWSNVRGHKERNLFLCWLA